MERLPHPQARRHRALRLLRLEREHLAVLAELKRRGGMRGRVRPEQRPASWALDRIEAAFQASWMEAA